MGNVGIERLGHATGLLFLRLALFNRNGQQRTKRCIVGHVLARVLVLRIARRAPWSQSRIGFQ